MTSTLHPTTAAPHESGPPIESERLGLWLFLGSETLLFGALIGAWLFLRVGSRDFPGPEGHLERLLVAGNTLLLVASSFTLARAVRSQRRGARARWLAATLLLGAAFLGLQLHEYAGLFAQGLAPRTNLYWSGFFVLTGVHGAHVLAGLVALAWFGTRALHGRGGLGLELAAAYWHFVDLVWIVLFTLLYLAS